MGNIFECGRLVPELSLLFQKLYIRTKQVVSIFVLIYFGRIFTWTYNQNKRYNISDCWYRDMLNFDFLSMGLGLTFPPHLCAWFFKKDISHVIFNQLTKVHCLVVFTSWDIGQHVCCSYLLSSLWHLKVWN